MFQKKKSLGQHFLRSQSAIRAIADAGAIEHGERVLEIGPGEGVLTSELLSRGARVTAIEKDRRLIPILTEKFTEAIRTKQLEIIEADALLVDPQRLFKKQPYKLVANIPYYVTGAIIKKFLTAAHQPSRMVLLVQKEVAQRIAREKKESILSLSVKAYGTPRYVKTVPRGAFSPAPAVDSAILSIENINRSHFTKPSQEARFFELLHAGFGQKRKLLASNVKHLLSANTLEKNGVAEKARSEDVPLELWLKLSKVASAATIQQTA